MEKLKIEYLPKEQLKAYANNAKLHPGEQIEQIKRSIKEFGSRDPIAVWKDNEVIEGHGRLLAVMEMPEVETVPIIRCDDMTDEQRRAYMNVHNKLTMNTGFDFTVLQEELESISIDMTQFGFEEIHLDGFFDDDTGNDGAEQEKQPTFRIIAICENQDSYDKVLAFLADNSIEYQEL